MVCLGNICRSPLAEGILKAKTNHLDVVVDSAGTAAYHIGNPPDIRSISIANIYGIDLTTQRARQFCINDFEVPVVGDLKGFKVKTQRLILEGMCDKCQEYLFDYFVEYFFSC